MFWEQVRGTEGVGWWLLCQAQREYFPILILLLHLRLNKIMNNHGETTRETTRVFGLEMIWKFLFSVDVFSVIRAHAQTHIHTKKSFCQRALFLIEGIPNSKTPIVIQEQ